MVVKLHRLAREQPTRLRGDGGYKVVLHRFNCWFPIDHVSRFSNHGSFYFNQIAALKILVGNNTGALESLGEYFNGIYKNQINADGEQPLEAERTRPYHYRTYNLAAMIVSF